MIDEKQQNIAAGKQGSARRGLSWYTLSEGERVAGARVCER
jgi:hypothetical protein